MVLYDYQTRGDLKMIDNFILDLSIDVIRKGLTAWEDYQLDDAFRKFWKVYHGGITE